MNLKEEEIEKLGRTRLLFHTDLGSATKFAKELGWIFCYTKHFRFIDKDDHGVQLCRDLNELGEPGYDDELEIYVATDWVIKHPDLALELGRRIQKYGWRQI